MTTDEILALADQIEKAIVVSVSVQEKCPGPVWAIPLENDQVAAIVSALRVSTQPSVAVPVAWRWKVYGIWHYASGFPVSGAEPLYALQSTEAALKARRRDEAVK